MEGVSTNSVDAPSFLFLPQMRERGLLYRDVMLAGTWHYPYTSSIHDLYSVPKGSAFFSIVLAEIDIFL